MEVDGESSRQQKLTHYLLGHILDSAVVEGRLQAGAGNTVTKVLVILHRPALNHLVGLRLDFPAHKPRCIVRVSPITISFLQLRNPLATLRTHAYVEAQNPAGDTCRCGLRVSSSASTRAEEHHYPLIKGSKSAVRH